MKNISALLCILLLTACLDLDSNLFNPNANPITSYQLNEYKGEVEIQVGDEYNIDPSLIDLFQLKSGDNDIYCLYVGDKEKISTDTVILYCHGNKDHLDFYWPRIKLLANTGRKNQYGVMSLDYQGFGLSGGTPSENNLYQDVQTAINWLSKQGLTSDRLIIYGFSMGSAPATLHCVAPIHFRTFIYPTKLILESPFASASVFVQDGSALNLPATYVTDLHINVAEYIKDVKQPLLWMHGIDDDFISIETHGELVFGNHPGPKTAVRVKDANHSDVPEKLLYKNYHKIIQYFITN